MNVVIISPHFPPNFFNFAVAADRAGLSVLGIGDISYDSLRPELRSALTEYFYVADLHNYSELVRACGYFTYRYGKIDRLESHSEYWLQQDARLREDFNIPGLRPRDMEVVKRKIRMKQVFEQAGIDVAPGGLINSLDEAMRVVAETGYPIVAKPDIGVGAAETYQINNLMELQRFFTNKPAEEYVLERYVYGTLYSYDGMTDRDGRIVFSTAHTYHPSIMDVVNEDVDVYACSVRKVPDALEDIGSRAVHAFKVRERFFHIEFIHQADENKWVALEMNMRPPGGPMMDVINYANDIDMYREWINVVAFNTFTSETERPYFCAFVGRKTYIPHAHTREDILTNLKEFIIHHEPIPPVFARAMGNYAYLVRSPYMEELQKAIDYILATKVGGRENEY
jgi:hypothetical protein